MGLVTEELLPCYDQCEPCHTRLPNLETVIHGRYPVVDPVVALGYSITTTGSIREEWHALRRKVWSAFLGNSRAVCGFIGTEGALKSYLPCSHSHLGLLHDQVATRP